MTRKRRQKAESTAKQRGAQWRHAKNLLTGGDDERRQRQHGLLGQRAPRREHQDVVEAERQEGQHRAGDAEALHGFEPRCKKRLRAGLKAWGVTFLCAEIQSGAVAVHADLPQTLVYCLCDVHRVVVLRGLIVADLLHMSFGGPPMRC